MNYTYYRSDNGQIVEVGTCADELWHIHRDRRGTNLSYEEGIQRDRHNEYYVDGVAVARPDMPIVLDRKTMKAKGTDHVTFSNVPKSCIMEMSGTGINKTMMEVDDDVEFDADDVGTFTFKFSCFPYKDTEYTVIAK